MKHKKPKKSRPPEACTLVEIQRLIAAIDPRYPSGVRNRALVAVLFGAGLRVSEALALERHDYDEVKQTVKVRHGKGDKFRIVPLLPGTTKHLAPWLEHRDREGANGDTPLFYTLARRSIQSAYVRALLGRLGRKASIPHRVHPHGLRHSAAVFLHDAGWSHYELMRFLGHSNLATTTAYLATISPREIVERMRGVECSF